METLEGLGHMLATMLLLLAVIGIPLYIALVIAIPICKGLDWLSGRKARPPDPTDDDAAARPGR